MKKLFCFVLTLIISTNIFPAYAHSLFTDVAPSHYCHDAATNVRNAGIIQGYEDGSFRPDNPISRAEMATVMCLMSKDRAPSAPLTVFSDVPENHWASKYIAGASQKNIISGSGNGLFRPQDNVTFEEAVKMTVMATGKGQNITPYKSDWSKAYLEIAQAIGITKGTRGQKGEYATRGDVVVMINNALGIMKNENIILYSKPMYNSGTSTPFNMTFALDDKIFLQDNTIYNKDAAKASLMLSMTAYSSINIDTLPKGNLNTLLDDLGFTDVKTTDLTKTYADNDVTEFTIGRKAVELAEEKTELVVVSVRGTNGTLKEWTSNFDIGAGTADETYNTVNHKGFDITSQRVITEIENYIAKYIPEGSTVTLWLTGHSRGGSIANICAASLEDKGLKTFSYTFGASRTTVNTKAGEYANIFNVANADDLVTYLPIARWGFTTYGKTAQISVGNSLHDKWSAVTGLKKYNYTKTIPAIEVAIATCSADREGCYAYPEGEKVTVEVKTKAEGEQAIEALKNSYAPSSLDYCEFEIKDSKESKDFPYVVEVRMQPAFLMHNIAAVMSNKISELKFVAMALPTYLRPTQVAVISAYAGGIVHPHAPETYYAIVDNITANDFK